MITILIILIFVIQFCETLRCYSCHKEKQCDILFSSTSLDINIVYGNNLYDSCSITVNSNGLIIRDIIPSYKCRSSSYEFCCNQDLCNYHRLPPLPAFNTFKCVQDICQMNDNQCNNINNSVIYLSSATESCIRIHNEIVHKSYQIGCSPNHSMIKSLNSELITQDLYCCNYPECNQQTFITNEAIRCYTCDSRITGLDGCSILNISSSYVYNSASSNPFESCAMIIGLAGKDLISGRSYSAFTIRTFINNCTNQSLGNVTYGGITFYGRIDCCSTSLCNIHPLYTNLNILRMKTRKPVNRILKIIVFSCTVFLGLIFIIIGISLSIYRFYLNRSRIPSTPDVISDGVTVIFLPPDTNDNKIY